jgi:hypothetical protein
MLKDQQVAGARDRQELGNALDDTEDEGFDHLWHPRAFWRLGRQEISTPPTTASS